ncbi:Hsp33 family molecular chaperone HslO [Alicyclobacillus fastidiosus]|uniref:33 kDa chaperonin n=1 Tax=Alicyclobacillus fastidiosus TaxID=392011 RepID=A0ABY6ZHY7_9BACL|nr:Hsp33 family molecular chaperone HslO [Alicyclobacillus fastidiosus]WAH42228.1 Hsp33 family molecular chaperone HslO [Alicyclobacillus fastidiosus]GMA64024.1 33 kDa chaperonin [Alicyclobacillus fastidiosus]
MDKDTVIRATARDGRVLIFSCLTTDLVGELQRRHDTWPVVTAALGRTASITAMMATMLKNEERITVKIDGDGPIGQIWVEATPAGSVRGYVDNPHVDLPLNAASKLDVGGGVGQGQLYVIRDMGLKDFYTGSSELQTGEIADDFTYYFVTSEQVPSAVGAGVLVGTDDQPIVAGGFLIQLMPGHDESDIAYVEERLREVPSVTHFLQEYPSAQALLLKLCPDAQIHHISDVQFRCTCSYERLSRVLISLGREELATLREEAGEAELTCHFCGNKYHFSASDLDAMIEQIDEEPQA